MKDEFKLTARFEPFDTFWEAPADIEKGYASFAKFYRRNYLRFFPGNKNANILVISCGAGYLIDLLNKEGYLNVLGIDSDPEKVRYAENRNLNCKVERAFEYLRRNERLYDIIFAEQEINHLTKKEILKFMELCAKNLNKNGLVFIHSLNGANPITGSEALAQNFDHYNTFTEYSLKQIFLHSGFRDIKIIPLKLYVFYENPLNYVGLILDAVLNLIFSVSFKFYGKVNKSFTKKIAAVGRKK